MSDEVFVRPPMVAVFDPDEIWSAINGSTLAFFPDSTRIQGPHDGTMADSAAASPTNADPVSNATMTPAVAATAAGGPANGGGSVSPPPPNSRQSLQGQHTTFAAAALGGATRASQGTQPQGSSSTRASGAQSAPAEAAAAPESAANEERVRAEFISYSKIDDYNLLLESDNSEIYLHIFAVNIAVWSKRELLNQEIIQWRNCVVVNGAWLVILVHPRLISNTNSALSARDEDTAFKKVAAAFLRIGNSEMQEVNTCMNKFEERFCKELYPNNATRYGEVQTPNAILRAITGAYTQRDIDLSQKSEALLSQMEDREWSTPQFWIVMEQLVFNHLRFGQYESALSHFSSMARVGTTKLLEDGAAVVERCDLVRYCEGHQTFLVHRAPWNPRGLRFRSTPLIESLLYVLGSEILLFLLLGNRHRALERFQSMIAAVHVLLRDGVPEGEQAVANHFLFCTAQRMRRTVEAIQPRCAWASLDPLRPNGANPAPVLRSANLLTAPPSRGESTAGQHGNFSSAASIMTGTSPGRNRGGSIPGGCFTLCGTTTIGEEEMITPADIKALDAGELAVLTRDLFVATAESCGYQFPPLATLSHGMSCVTIPTSISMALKRNAAFAAHRRRKVTTAPTVTMKELLASRAKTSASPPTNLSDGGAAVGHGGEALMRAGSALRGDSVSSAAPPVIDVPSALRGAVPALTSQESATAAFIDLTADAARAFDAGSRKRYQCMLLCQQAEALLTSSPQEAAALLRSKVLHHFTAHRNWPMLGIHVRRTLGRCLYAVGKRNPDAFDVVGFADALSFVIGNAPSDAERLAVWHMLTNVATCAAKRRAVQLTTSPTNSGAPSKRSDEQSQTRGGNANAYVIPKAALVPVRWGALMVTAPTHSVRSLGTNFDGPPPPLGQTDRPTSTMSFSAHSMTSDYDDAPPPLTEVQLGHAAELTVEFIAPVDIRQMVDSSNPSTTPLIELTLDSQLPVRERRSSSVTGFGASLSRAASPGGPATGRDGSDPQISDAARLRAGATHTLELVMETIEVEVQAVKGISAANTLIFSDLESEAATPSAAQTPPPPSSSTEDGSPSPDLRADDSLREHGSGFFPRVQTTYGHFAPMAPRQFKIRFKAVFIACHPGVYSVSQTVLRVGGLALSPTHSTSSRIGGLSSPSDPSFPIPSPTNRGPFIATSPSQPMDSRQASSDASNIAANAGDIGDCGGGDDPLDLEGDEDEEDDVDHELFYVPDPSRTGLVMSIEPPEELHFFADPNIPAPAVSVSVRLCKGAPMPFEFSEWLDTVLCDQNCRIGRRDSTGALGSSVLGASFGAHRRSGDGPNSGGSAKPNAGGDEKRKGCSPTPPAVPMEGSLTLGHEGSETLKPIRRGAAQLLNGPLTVSDDDEDDSSGRDVLTAMSQRETKPNESQNSDAKDAKKKDEADLTTSTSGPVKQLHQKTVSLCLVDDPSSENFDGTVTVLKPGDGDSDEDLTTHDFTTPKNITTHPVDSSTVKRNDSVSQDEASLKLNQNVLRSASPNKLGQARPSMLGSKHPRKHSRQLSAMSGVSALTENTAEGHPIVGRLVLCAGQGAPASEDVVNVLREMHAAAMSGLDTSEVLGGEVDKALGALGRQLSDPPATMPDIHIASSAPSVRSSRSPSPQSPQSRAGRANTAEMFGRLPEVQTGVFIPETQLARRSLVKDKDRDNLKMSNDALDSTANQSSTVATAREAPGPVNTVRGHSPFHAGRAGSVIAFDMAHGFPTMATPNAAAAGHATLSHAQGFARAAAAATSPIGETSIAGDSMDLSSSRRSTHHGVGMPGREASVGAGMVADSHGCIGHPISVNEEAILRLPPAPTDGAMSLASLAAASAATAAAATMVSRTVVSEGPSGGGGGAMSPSFGAVVDDTASESSPSFFGSAAGSPGARVRPSLQRQQQAAHEILNRRASGDLRSGRLNEFSPSGRGRGLHSRSKSHEVHNPHSFDSGKSGSVPAHFVTEKKATLAVEQTAFDPVSVSLGFTGDDSLGGGHAAHHRRQKRADSAVVFTLSAPHLAGSFHGSDQTSFPGSPATARGDNDHHGHYDSILASPNVHRRVSEHGDHHHHHGHGHDHDSHVRGAHLHAAPNGMTAGDLPGAPSLLGRRSSSAAVLDTVFEVSSSVPLQPAFVGHEQLATVDPKTAVAEWGAVPKQTSNPPGGVGASGSVGGGGHHGASSGLAHTSSMYQARGTSPFRRSPQAAPSQPAGLWTPSPLLPPALQSLTHPPPTPGGPMSVMRCGSSGGLLRSMSGRRDRSRDRDRDRDCSADAVIATAGQQFGSSLPCNVLTQRTSTIVFGCDFHGEFRCVTKKVTLPYREALSVEYAFFTAMNRHHCVCKVKNTLTTTAVALRPPELVCLNVLGTPAAFETEPVSAVHQTACTKPLKPGETVVFVFELAPTLQAKKEHSKWERIHNSGENNANDDDEPEVHPTSHLPSGQHQGDLASVAGVREGTVTPTRGLMSNPSFDDGMIPRAESSESRPDTEHATPERPPPAGDATTNARASSTGRPLAIDVDRDTLATAGPSTAGPTSSAGGAAMRRPMAIPPLAPPTPLAVPVGGGSAPGLPPPLAVASPMTPEELFVQREVHPVRLCIEYTAWERQAVFELAQEKAKESTANEKLKRLQQQQQQQQLQCQQQQSQLSLLGRQGTGINRRHSDVTIRSASAEPVGAGTSALQRQRHDRATPTPDTYVDNASFGTSSFAAFDEAAAGSSHGLPSQPQSLSQGQAHGELPSLRLRRATDAGGASMAITASGRFDPSANVELHGDSSTHITDPPPSSTLTLPGVVHTQGEKAAPTNDEDTVTFDRTVESAPTPLDSDEEDVSLSREVDLSTDASVLQRGLGCGGGLTIVSADSFSSPHNRAAGAAAAQMVEALTTEAAASKTRVKEILKGLGGSAKAAEAAVRALGATEPVYNILHAPVARFASRRARPFTATLLVSERSNGARTDTRPKIGTPVYFNLTVTAHKHALSPTHPYLSKPLYLVFDAHHEAWMRLGVVRQKLRFGEPGESFSFVMSAMPLKHGALPMPKVRLLEGLPSGGAVPLDTVHCRRFLEVE